MNFIYKWKKWKIKNEMIERYLVKYDGCASGDDYAHWLHHDIVLYLNRHNALDDQIAESYCSILEKVVDNKNVLNTLVKYKMNQLYNRTKYDLFMFKTYFKYLNWKEAKDFKHMSEFL